ncbi:MAG: proton-conducting transporter membrane subunit [Planctomycetota bacterium]|nr:proton-conducting transporter membrane subunit [Planctomycetota bacterium]
MDYMRLIAVPLAAGALVYLLWLLGRSRPRAVGKVTAAVAVLAMLWTAWSALALFRAPPGPYAYDGTAIDLGPLTFALAFRADGLSGLIVLAAAGIALLVTLYSVRAMAEHPRAPVFHAWVLWTVAAVLAAALANNFLLLIVAWEVATVGLYLLVGMGRPEGRAGAMKTFAILGFADVCLLLGVAIVGQAGGEANPLFLVSGVGGLETGEPLMAVAYLLMAAAALAKAGAMPLHTWIPSASEDAPTPVFALLPAALDKLLGIYLLARITFEVFAVSTALATVLMVIGAATILLAVMMAMIQHNLKRLLSFHAVSQVGYMVLGMGLAAWVLAKGRAAGGATPAQEAVATVAFCGGLLHMLNNAIYKSALFLVAGSVERAAGTTRLDRLGGLARMLPVAFVCFLVAGLAIAGVPPLNGFVSKWLIYQGALAAGSGLAVACLVVAILGSALTLAVVMKAGHSVFLGTRGSAVPVEGIGRESGWMAVAMIVLAVACVGLGVWGGPAVGGLILPAAEAVGLPATGIDTAGWALSVRGGAGLWEPSVVTGLILIGVLVGVLVYLYRRALRVRVVGNFVAGEDSSSDELWHVSGTHFYETIRRLPVLRVIFGDASVGAFDLYRLVGQYGYTLVERLRAWHTGLLAAYASWIIIGLVVLVTVLALG